MRSFREGGVPFWQPMRRHFFKVIMVPLVLAISCPGNEAFKRHHSDRRFKGFFLLFPTRHLSYKMLVNPLLALNINSNLPLIRLNSVYSTLLVCKASSKFNVFLLHAYLSGWVLKYSHFSTFVLCKVQRSKGGLFFP